MPTTCKLIAKTTLGSSATSIDFQNIPATYTDLLVYYSIRGDRSDAIDYMRVRFNGANSDTSHSSRYLTGNGNSVGSGTFSYCWLGPCPANNATSSTFGNGEIYIPNYAGSTNKSLSVTHARENNTTSADLDAIAGLWSSSSAIDRLTIQPVLGSNFVSGSAAYLYGITKSA